MAYAYSELVSQAKSWAKNNMDAGWMPEVIARPLLDYDARTPDSLFQNLQYRPLIVAFLGGTGVGKSSLLNRLAGQDIAKTGVERPTSREVTLYHHHTVAIQQLPEALPIEQINLAQHTDENNRNIIWIDMPDFDSTELKNKHQVLQWLPHIDVLVYVVSPERYRDNKAWELLQSEGGRHAWLFALNQWDKGLPEQFDDFIQQLTKAGFDDPIVYRTSCGNTENLQDEYHLLQTMIQSLASKNTVEQLEIRGVQVRKQDLQDKIQQCLQAMGGETGYAELQSAWTALWSATMSTLMQGFDWPLQNLAGKMTQNDAQLLSIGHSAANFWDDWAQSRFEDTLDKLVLNASQQELPVQPLKQHLETMRQDAAEIVHSHAELAARKALANPGNSLQRSLLKLARFCEIFLPLAAMTWVAYQLLQGFYQGSQNQSGYLGTDFAIHSVLLIAIVWLLPYFAQKKLKPSLEKIALQGLKVGTETGMAALEEQVIANLQQIAGQRSEIIASGKELLEACAQLQQLDTTSDHETLSRMLLK